jgi:hypothetical protein
VINVGIAMWMPETSQVFFKFDVDNENIPESIEELDHFLSVVSPYYEYSEFRDMINKLVCDNAIFFKWSHIMSGICTCCKKRCKQLYYEFIIEQKKVVGENETYSENEKLLIESFGMTDISEQLEPLPLYWLMVEKAFVRNINGPHVESLRRCYKAMMGMSVFRLTPEFDELIIIS